MIYKITNGVKIFVKLSVLYSLMSGKGRFCSKTTSLDQNQNLVENTPKSGASVIGSFKLTNTFTILKKEC